MHFFMVYWTGRVQGADHATALRVALASQLPDDVNELKAPTRKWNAVVSSWGSPKPSPVPGVTEADHLMRTANNLHALAINPEEAEDIAREATRLAANKLPIKTRFVQREAI